MTGVDTTGVYGLITPVPAARYRLESFSGERWRLAHDLLHNRVRASRVAVSVGSKHGTAK